MIDPLLVDINGLLSSCLVSLLIEPLRPDVKHQLLYVLWSKRYENSEHVVPFDPLYVLEIPVVWNMFQEARQLNRLRPDACN